MTTNAVIAVWGISALSALVLSGFVAALKNRDYSFWMATSFLVPPALLVLLALPKLKGPQRRRRTLDEESRDD